MIISALVPLVVLAVIAYAIAQATGGARGLGPGAPHADGDLREEVVRFFRLALQFGATVLVAEGVGGLIAQVLPRSEGVLREPADLARALSFTVVGVPVLVGLARWTQRRLRDDPDEATSTGWGQLLTVGLTVSLVVAMTSSHTVLRWVIGPRLVDQPELFEATPRLALAFPAGSVGRALAWTAMWAVHWRLLRTRPEKDGGISLPVLAGSLAGFGSLAFGAGETLGAALRYGYDRVATDIELGDGPAAIRRAVPLLVIGAVVWTWYWLRHGVRSERTGPTGASRWYAYVLLAGVAAPLAAAVTGASQVLHTTLEWVLGDPGAPNASAQFAGVPVAVATTVVGVAGWAYHRGLLGFGVARARSEVDRVYDYLAAAVGLVVSVIGITVAFVSAAEAVTDPRVTIGTDGGIANTVVFAATMVVVGVPVWAWFWRAAQRHVGEPSERASVTRRVYLLLLFGVAAIVALISLVVAVFFAFDDLARGMAGTSTVFRMRVPGSLVLTMAVVAGYHALVYRSDRAALAAAGPGAAAGSGLSETGAAVAVRSLVVLGPAPAADELAGALRQRLGIRVQVWHTTTYQPAGAVDLDPLVAALSGLDARHALVTLGPAVPTVAGFDPA